MKGCCTISHEFNHIAGPRSVYAKVVLTLEPAESFEFASAVRWPDGNFDDWVVDGILDALFCLQHRPAIAARFRLQEVGWHPVNSAPIAYYWAAKNAVAGYLTSREQEMS